MMYTCTYIFILKVMGLQDGNIRGLNMYVNDVHKQKHMVESINIVNCALSSLVFT